MQTEISSFSYPLNKIVKELPILQCLDHSLPVDKAMLSKSIEIVIDIYFLCFS